MKTTMGDMDMGRLAEKIKSLFGTKKVSPEKEEAKNSITDKNSLTEKAFSEERYRDEERLNIFLSDRDSDDAVEKQDWEKAFDDALIREDWDAAFNAKYYGEYSCDRDNEYEEYMDKFEIVENGFHNKKEHLLARKGELKGQTLGGDSVQATAENRGKGTQLPEGVKLSKKMRREER